MYLSNNSVSRLSNGKMNQFLDLGLLFGREIHQLCVELLLFCSGVTDPLRGHNHIPRQVMGIQDQSLETASMCVVEWRRSGSNLLPHVTLDKAQELRSKVEEIWGNRVYRDEVEGKFGVQVRIIMGPHTCMWVKGGRTRRLQCMVKGFTQ